MFRRKSVGLRVEPLGNSALMEYPCKDIPLRTTQSYLLMRKGKIKPNTQPDMP